MAQQSGGVLAHGVHSSPSSLQVHSSGDLTVGAVNSMGFNLYVPLSLFVQTYVHQNRFGAGKSSASSSLLGFTTPRHLLSFCCLHNFAFPDEYHIARVAQCGRLKKRSVFALSVSTSEYSLFSSLAHVLADRLFCVFNFWCYLYIIYLRPL